MAGNVAGRISGVIGLLLAVFSTSSHAINIKVDITVDNSYALYFGTGTAATNFVGNDFSWPTTETYTFNLPASDYIYVVTASDLAVAQGFLGQFQNLDANFKFYSNDPQWEVTATGLGAAAPYLGSAADLTLLSAQIVVANAGGNPSLGWTGLTAGPANGAAPWGTRPAIDAAARWTWYSANGDPDPTTPGFDHDEWLVFRVKVGATPVSEPHGMVLFGLALGVAGAIRHRRQ